MSTSWTAVDRIDDIKSIGLICALPLPLATIGSSPKPKHWFDDVLSEHDVVTVVCQRTTCQREGRQQRTATTSSNMCVQPI